MVEPNDRGGKHVPVDHPPKDVDIALSRHIPITNELVFPAGAYALAP